MIPLWRKQTTKREKGSILEPQYQDEDVAREYLELLRWPDGATCPHCGAMDRVYKITPKQTEPYQDKSGRWRTPRKGLWKNQSARKGVRQKQPSEQSDRLLGCQIDA